MKKLIADFFHRGMIGCGFGPIILAIVYLNLQKNGVIQTLTVNEVCIAIFSISALAFLAAGLNVIYQVERLPLMMAILIHGGVLYLGYLITYLLNGWFQSGMTSIIVFSIIFVVSYVTIWVVIYCVTKKRTERVNEILKMKQKSIEE